MSPLFPSLIPPPCPWPLSMPLPHCCLSMGYAYMQISSLDNLSSFNGFIFFSLQFLPAIIYPLEVDDSHNDQNNEEYRGFQVEYDQ